MPLSSQTINKNRIALNAKYRDLRKELKEKIYARRLDPSIEFSTHMENVFKLHKLSRNSSKIRIRNRCSITGRGRGVFRYFGICGIKIREMAMKGFLPGIRHASW
jgi:small subunit ribosomal protein S14